MNAQKNKINSSEIIFLRTIEGKARLAGISNTTYMEILGTHPGRDSGNGASKVTWVPAPNVG